MRPAMGRRVATPSPSYEPRRPAQQVLHQIVLAHFETFRAQAASLRDGEGLPRFVEREFREFLTCGCLAAGFARFYCDACGHDRLVPFSCKGRGFCPSCGGRRMAERAAHLVDHVLPDVPVRQWVLSLPYRLRYMLAWDRAGAAAR
jgi:Transposase zinc-binding domain